MMYTKDEIENLRSLAKEAKLRAPHAFWNASAEDLVNICNGIGADWQSEKTRKIITKSLKYAEPAAMIHDFEYSRSDGDKERQERVDRRFLSNGLAYVQKCFPQWWNWRRWLGERAVLAMYAVLERLGYVAWCLSFVENHKKKGKK